MSWKLRFFKLWIPVGVWTGRWLFSKNARGMNLLQVVGSTLRQWWPLITPPVLQIRLTAARFCIHFDVPWQSAPLFASIVPVVAHPLHLYLVQHRLHLPRYLRPHQNCFLEVKGCRWIWKKLSFAWMIFRGYRPSELGSDCSKLGLMSERVR